MPEVKFCDYLIITPDWFIDYIQSEIRKRDIKGLTGGNRISDVRVTGEHPLVALTGSLLQGGGEQAWSGLLPAISVIESDEDETYTTIGQGKRASGRLTKSWVSQIRESFPDIRDRNKTGLITDTQLKDIETMIGIKDYILCEVEEFMLKESVFVSLWCHSLEERKILGTMLRSVIFDMRKAMLKARLTDIHIRVSKGLNNFNFGRVLYGQEIEVSYVNTIRNLTASEDMPVDPTLEVITFGEYYNRSDNTHINNYEEEEV